VNTAAADLAGWRLLLPGADDYPALLAQVREPPAIRVTGDLDAGSPMLAIVGSRDATEAALDLAYELAAGLAEAGLVIVSGLARGVDAVAHQGALEAGGRTVAVMGTGPGTIYPRAHGGLATRIQTSGALVSQFPAGTPPLRSNFPARNAVISGLCLGVVVVEARVRSGAMLTAGSAGDQGRVVMAVPGSVSNVNAAGCHRLIRDGARLVTSPDEVLDELRGDPLLRTLPTGSMPPLLMDWSSGAVTTDQPRLPIFGDHRDAVMEALRGGGRTVDEITQGGDTGAMLAALGRLRIDGLVTLEGGVYSRAGTRRRT
jgi:DNA processing protein